MSEKIILSLQNAPLEIELDQSAGTARISGKEISYTLASLGKNEGVLEVDGKQIPFRFARNGEELWLWTSAGSKQFKIVPQTAKRSSGASEHIPSSGLIKAPMPGKVLDINVNQNDVVKSGDVLYIMESMKMELSIEAPIDGIVEEIFVQEGSSVNLGDDAMHIKER